MQTAKQNPTTTSSITHQSSDTGKTAICANLQPSQISLNFVVVPVLTYLLTTQKLTLEEVNGLAVDVIFAGVDSVSS